MLNSQFSYLYDDDGYKIMGQNKYIDRIIPYKSDIDPRIIMFLRDLYYHKISNIIPCVPL